MFHRCIPCGFIAFAHAALTVLSELVWLRRAPWLLLGFSFVWLLFNSSAHAPSARLPKASPPTMLPKMFFKLLPVFKLLPAALSLAPQHVVTGSRAVSWVTVGKVCSRALAACLTRLEPILHAVWATAWVFPNGYSTAQQAPCHALRMSSQIYRSSHRSTHRTTYVKSCAVTLLCVSSQGYQTVLAMPSKQLHRSPTLFFQTVLEE